MERRERNPAEDVAKAEAAVVTIAALALFALLRIFI
jgi:hypothetical protein